MENNIRERIIADTAEYDKKLQIKKNKANRITGVFAVVLVLLFMYFGFFNTKYELLTAETEEGIVEYGIRVVDSTTFFVKIPARYQGKDITFLTSNNECGLFLLGMYIPDGIRHIGVVYWEWGILFGSGNNVTNSPFLMYVRLPNGLEEIHEYAFRGNSCLRWVQFPKQVEDAIIGEKAFYETGISSLVLPEGFTTIDRYAFAYCNKLREVYLPDSLMNIGNVAFRGCERLKEVRISDDATHLPNYMFEGCKKLKTIHWPETLEYIGVEGLSGVRLEDANYPNNMYYKGADWGTNIYDIVKENEVLASKTGIPIEVFETDVDFSKIWIEGQYYELPMTKDDFLSMDDWSVVATELSDEQERITLKHNATEHGLVVYVDKDNYVKCLRIRPDDGCLVVVPGGTMPYYTSLIRFWVQYSTEEVDLFRLTADYWDTYDNHINYPISFGEKYECEITSLDHYTGVIDGMTISVAEE